MVESCSKEGNRAQNHTQGDSRMKKVWGGTAEPRKKVGGPT